MKTALEKISIRELSRQPKKTFERVQARGQTLLVTNHGHPIALLVPLRTGPASHTTVLEPEPCFDEATLSRLSPVQRKIVEGVADGCRNAERLALKIGEPANDVLMDLSRLEIEGLVRRTFSGYEPRFPR